MKKNTARPGLGSLALTSATLFSLAALTGPFHLVDTLTAEESAVRKRLLKLYARFEVQLLRVFYWLLNRPLIRSRWVRRFLYHALARFMSRRAVVSKVMTLREMEEFIEGLPVDSAIAVGPCRCRLATGACDHPLQTDIVIMTGTPIWLDLFPKDYRVIDKEETLAIVRDCYALGLVPMLDRHMYFRGNANHFVICNCCGCSCLPIIGYRIFKHDGYRYIPSGYRAVTDAGLCRGDGACVEACAFNERVVVAGRSRVLDCQGCGQCARACPHGAVRMVKR